MTAADRVDNQASRPAGGIQEAGHAGPAGDGVDLAALEPLTTLLVRTGNSLYRIIVLRDMRVLIKGGRCFPNTTSCELLSFGVNVLRFGWIGVGLRMEIHSGERCVVTSPVTSMTRVSPCSRPA